jgi:hypothetical protein
VCVCFVIGFYILFHCFYRLFHYLELSTKPVLQAGRVKSLFLSYNHIARRQNLYCAYIIMLRFEIEWLRYDASLSSDHMFEDSK